MSQRSELESKVVIANNLIAQGYTPAQAADMAGITASDVTGALEELDDGTIGITDVFFEDERVETPVVPEDERQTYYATFKSTTTTNPKSEPTVESDRLHAEADELTAERNILKEAKRQDLMSQGLTRKEAGIKLLRDPELLESGRVITATRAEGDRAFRTVPGSATTTYFNPDGEEVTKEEYTAIAAPENNITAATVGVASSDDVTAAFVDIDESVPYEPGTADITDEEQAILDEEAEATIAFNAAVKDAEEQQELIPKENDWRVRLHLAPDANYLYKAPIPGILAPLNETDGIIFPYTPQIAVQYNAEYENYDLVHSNYRGYFYKGSRVENILVTATFTANDLAEANYMLATIHFLKSATKMFYGQDRNHGMPPPVLFLTGLGEYQFNNHPCAITMINLNMPNDVDYIACGKPEGMQPVPTPKRSDFSSPAARLKGSGLSKNNAANIPSSRDDTYTKATYVPTKIDINFTLIPIQTRDQVSSEFSLEDYASGILLKKGFW